MWRKRLSLILLICWFNSNLLLGQSDAIFSIGIEMGYEGIYNKDVLSSPLDYHGFGLPIGFFLKKEKDTQIQELEAKFILPFLTNNYPIKSGQGTQLSNWATVQINYSFLAKLNNAPQHALGGTFSNSFFIREYDFLDGGSWELISFLGMTYQWQQNINSNSNISLRVTLPVFSFLHRPPDITLDEAFLDVFFDQGVGGILKYGKWRWQLQDWKAIKVQATYHWQLSERWTLGCQVGLQYYQIDFPQQVENLNLPILCQFAYQF